MILSHHHWQVLFDVFNSGDFIHYQNLEISREVKYAVIFPVNGLKLFITLLIAVPNRVAV